MNKNNFDSVRVGLAIIVVFAHIAALTEIDEFKMFQKIFNSDFAVKGFFAISGFLVAQSFLSSDGIKDYLEKRIRRIYPAYFGAILLCVAIGGYASTLQLHEFMTSAVTMKYVLSNLVFLNFLQSTLPNTFESNPIQAMNGSLWTIKVEVMLYFCIPPMIYLFRKFGSIKIFTLVFFMSTAWVFFFLYIFKGSIGAELSRQFPGQLAYFAFGTFLAINQKVLSKLKLITITSLILLFLINNTYLKILIDPIAYGAVVIYIATLKFKIINLGKYGDISYGIYLFHFPIIQLLVLIGVFKLNLWVGVALTLSLTIFISLISWHLIEKRFLKRSSHYLMAAK
ncbi:acyltransferase family protein [Zwartia vadi]|uniref:acyltransferase family protein n=1 Tax=Zwartia vadi TaxID=3058168 RepID=UPI0025B45626|nr:acyltransferase [Zwartia vadi]MDN3988256.1 acyltransferase [Zwartia vadi]